MSRAGDLSPKLGPLRCLLAAGAFLSVAASAGEDWTHRIRLAFQLGLNVDAQFSTGGDFAVSGSAPGPTGVPGVDHFYDDGYVRVDQTGNAQGRTTFWGYNSAAQYDPATETLTFSSANSFSVGESSLTAGGDPVPGFELVYGTDLVGWTRAQLGAELGVGLLAVGINDPRAAPATVSRTTHRFSTGGIAVPEAPYSGGARGEGPTILDVATALPSATEEATLTAAQELDSQVWCLRLGPTLRWDVHRRWTIAAGAGLALALVDSDYRYNETLLFGDGSQASNTGASSSTETLLGGYANLLVVFHLSEEAKPFEVFGGLQFLTLPDAEIRTAGREAVLRLGGTIAVQGGMSWSF